MNPEDGVLLGSMPEYAEKIKLVNENDNPEDIGKEDEWYKVAVCYNNDYMMFFYLQAENFDNEVKEWLENQMEEAWWPSIHSETVATREEN